MDEKVKSLDEKIEKYEKEFWGLSDDEVCVLAYRKIYEIKKNEEVLSDEEEKEIQEKDNLETILASNHKVGFLSTLILYCYSDLIKDNYNVYKQALINYQKVLDNYKKLAEELKINDALNLSHLFSYLLWNGYFSVTKEHRYNLNDRLMISGMYSFDVIKGHGVCLAYAELLANFLNTCDKEASLLNCLVPTKKGAVKMNYYPEIERKTSSNLSNQMFVPSLMFF